MIFHIQWVKQQKENWSKNSQQLPSWWLNQPISKICGRQICIISPGRIESKRWFETTNELQLQNKHHNIIKSGRNFVVTSRISVQGLSFPYHTTINLGSWSSCYFWVHEDWGNGPKDSTTAFSKSHLSLIPHIAVTSCPYLYTFVISEPSILYLIFQYHCHSKFRTENRWEPALATCNHGVVNHPCPMTRPY